MKYQLFFTACAIAVYFVLNRIVMLLIKVHILLRSPFISSKLAPIYLFLNICKWCIFPFAPIFALAANYGVRLMEKCIINIDEVKKNPMSLAKKYKFQLCNSKLKI